MTNTIYEAAEPIRKTNNKAEVDITIISSIHPPIQGYVVVDIEPEDSDEDLKEKARAQVKALHEKAIEEGKEFDFLWR